MKLNKSFYIIFAIFIVVIGVLIPYTIINSNYNYFDKDDKDDNNDDLNSGSSSSSSGGDSTSTTAICTDTDGGKIKNVAGHVTTTYWPMSYYDDCIDEFSVREYFCDGNILSEEIIDCDDGYECTETRSGDYCMKLIGYSEGETILSESDDGVLGEGVNQLQNPIEMDDIITGGDCNLGVKIDVWWDYVEESACSNIQGFEQMAFYFYDSNTGMALDVPRNVQKHFDYCPKYYDGMTDWMFVMQKTMNIFSCKIDYDYTVEVYACNCE